MSIFTKIINNEIEADKVYEDELIIAIKDIAPKAPVHILIIPKKAYSSMQDIPEKDLHIMQKVVEAAQFLAKKFSIANGYRFITNVGKDAGQEIQHLHFHLIGGKKLGALV